MAIFRREKGKRSREMCLGQCLGRRGNDPSLWGWRLSPSSGPRLQPMGLGGEGPPRRDEPRKSWWGRETEQMQEAGRNFMVQGVLEQGGRKRMKREIGGISFDTQAGTVSGCAWEEQSGRKWAGELNQRCLPSLETGIKCGGDLEVGCYRWWGDLK